MANKTDARESQLPQWARTELQVARMRRDEAEAKVKSLFPGAESDTYWMEYPIRHPLPKGARIRFQVGKDEFAFIEASLKDGCVIISGIDCISILPEASNAVRIKLVRG
mgnify:FL=1